MPQPLSKVKTSEVSYLQIYPNVSIERPSQAAKAMTVISTWAYIENTFLQIASRCLNTDFVVVAEILNGLSNFFTIQEVVKKAVKAAYPSDFQLFEAVCKVIKSSRDTRNKFAHWIWAVHTGIPNGICLIDPSHITILQAQISKYYLENPDIIAGGSGFGDLDDKSPDLDKSRIMVYLDKDLDLAIKEAETAALQVDTMMGLLNNIDGDVKKHFYNFLLEDERIQKALQKIRLNSQKRC